MVRTYSLTRRALIATSAVLLPGMTAAEPRPVYRDPRAPIELRVRDLLSRMTLDEKIAQMCSIWTSKEKILDRTGVFLPDRAAEVMPHGIGQLARPHDTRGTDAYETRGFRSIESTVAFVNAAQRYLVERTRLGIPALFHEETAHGYLAGDATIFPIPPGLASTWDPDLVEQAYSVAAREVRVRGGHVALSPVLDLARDPRFGRVEEFFSEDPYLTAQMGLASVRGQQGAARPLGKDKVFVTLKHFVHGAPLGGLNIGPADVSDRTLRETFLAPFEAVLKEMQPGAMMPSYNEVAGVPAHMNRDLLQKVGRERLGFRGAYFSDYGGVENLKDQHRVAPDLDEAAILAINAGVDADLPEGVSYQRLPNLVRAGRVSEAQIDAAVTRVLAMKFEAGLFENPYVDARRAVARTNTAADRELARKVAQKALVLLKNDGVLPLDPKARVKLAVIGPNAAKPLFGGYSGVNPRAVSILDGVRQAAGPGFQVEHAEGVRIVEPEPTGEHRYISFKLPDPKDNAKRVADAVDVARRSDVILLVVGDQPEITREAVHIASPGDRRTLGLFGDQDALVEAMIVTGKPIIALLINGRALIVDRLAERANALIEGWYLGQEGGRAFADVLFGVANPGGKLPVTFPGSVGELPAHYNRHPTADQNQYVEGKREPLFPFGFGLSYTTFEISEPRLRRQKISAGETAVVDVEVTNTGRMAGDEVVQIYVRDEYSSVPRPTLELKAFRRVTLAPGEKRTLSFELSPDALAFWNIDMRWVVEPGDFTISAGSSSASLKSTKLTVV